ncbi:MAG: serine/threonine-protein kinase [Gemmatimonadota bacterium]
MADLPIPEFLKAAVAGRYAVEAVIGRGGMATVYRARDLKHGRVVALKLLSRDLSATIGVERFLREIQIAARLQHPHVLLLIDSGEVDGLPYYVMPFVQGESLRVLIDRLGTLPPEQVVMLTAEVAGALDYAHREGLIHRDIKPENILLSEGHAIVADFGVAKAISTAAERSITRTGFPVGTVGYMSPEQAAGVTDLDQASDVFSLGCVVYEMLIGGPPGRWLSEDAGRVLRFLDAARDQRTRLDRLPGSVEQALAKALLFRSEQRYQTAGEFATELAAAFGTKPKYAESRVREIVRRAAELEATTPTEAGALSLGGIQQLAAQVGIPPAHVQAAASEVARSPGSSSSASVVKPNRFLGAPARIIVERMVEGETSEEDYPTLVDEIRMTIGSVGQTSTLGRSLAWRTVNPPGQGSRTVHASVTPLSGRTRIRLEETLSPIAGGLFGGLMGAIGGLSVPLSIALGLAEMHSVIAALMLLATGVGGSYGVARTLFRTIRQKREAELEQLADRLAGYLADVKSNPRRIGQSR